MNDWVPGWWEFVILALGTYRATRLLSWDTFPPIRKLRGWITGAEWHWGLNGDEHKRMPEESQQQTGRWSFRRPTLAELIDCPFCMSVYTASAVYGLWLAWPTPTLAVCAIAALSGVTGLLMKNAG